MRKKGVRPSFPLILPPILLHHLHQPLKSLHPLQLQPPCIKRLSIRLKPVQHIMLLYPMLRRIPMIALNKSHHLLIPFLPSFFLCHTLILFCPVYRDGITTFTVPCVSPQGHLHPRSFSTSSSEINLSIGNLKSLAYSSSISADPG